MASQTVSPHRFSFDDVQAMVAATDGGFVLPDLMAIEPLPRDRLPDSALLVVEVAYSTHAHDTRKASIYALASVPEYWIVDIEGDEVLVHREPRGDRYASVARHAPGDVVEPLLGVPAVDVAALLSG